MTVDCSDHAIDLETFTLGHIECPVDQDLDLKPLEKAMVLAVQIVPAIDSAALETNPFSIEPRCDLEAARVVGDHRPGIAASTTRTRHRFERRLAVRMSGVPMTGAAKPLRMEILKSRAQDRGHFRAAEIALARGAAPGVFTALEALDSGLQGIFTSAAYELGYQRPKPVRCLLQQVSTRISRSVED